MTNRQTHQSRMDKTTTKQKKLLYVDAANYATRFFPIRQRWNLNRARHQVRRFCHAASASGWTIVAFLDDATLTEEAKAKWRSRREREVRMGIRNVPQGALRLLGDLLAAEISTLHRDDKDDAVRYSEAADCDDTIASYAQADGASILSNDGDFLRYRNATYELYKDFSIQKGKLVLVRQDKVVRSASWRDILDPPPATGRCNPFRDCVEEGTYLRGSPSPLPQLGNVHIHVRTLRAALYAHLGLNEVREEFPVRDGTTNTTCVWDRKLVQANETSAELLLSPALAVSEYHQARPEDEYVTDEDWFKHQFAVRAVIAELCCTVSGSTLLATLEPLLKSMDASPNKNVNKNKKSPGLSDVEKFSTPKKTKPKESTHYHEWRKSQKTGETNREKRQRYLQLFPPKQKNQKPLP